MSQILMSSIGTVGNIVPFLRLGEEFVRRGHDVVLMTNCLHVMKYGKSPIQMRSIDTVEQYQNFVTDGQMLNRPSGLPLMFRRHYLPIVTREYDHLEQLMRASDTVIIANEAPGIAARLCAEKHRAPLVSVLTYPNHIEASALYDALIQGELSE